MINVKSFLLLLICISFSVAKEEWSDPEAITDEETDSTSPDIFVDPITKISHLVWVDNPDDSVWKLVYMTIRADGTKSDITVLDTDHKPEYARIDGAGDGQRIFITYDAKRTQGDEKKCENGEFEGCSEIFFTESNNNGKSWSKPVMISHDNPKDLIDRKKPHTLFVKGYKQVLITYWRNGTMCLSMRMGDLSPFTKEVALPFGNSALYQMMAYTIDEQSQKPIYHFTYVNWSFPDENLMYTYSVDLGQHWATSKRLMFEKHNDPSDSFFRPFTVADYNLVKNTVFIGFTYHNLAYLIWSNDNGKTWAAPLNLHPDSPQAVAPKLKICRQDNKHDPKVFYLTCMKSKIHVSNYIFGSLDVKTRKWTEYEQPMEEHDFNWYFDFDCYDADDGLYARVITQEYMDDNDVVYSQLFSDKENYLTQADS